MPPGSLPTLWNDDERFVRSYMSAYPGYYLTGDGGHLDPDGYLFVMGRTDDVINVAGHRLSTGSMEEVLASHPDVAECAVIGVADQLKGQLPRGFVVLKSGVATDWDHEQTVCAELVQMVREQIGAVAALREVARRRRAAQDPVRQDPAENDAEHRRRRRDVGAVHHRRRLRARHPAPSAPTRRNKPLRSRLRSHAANKHPAPGLRGH